MKRLAVFAAVIIVISAATDFEQWEQFKKTHNKTYKNVLEERSRFVIFKKNLLEIEEHNIRYNNGVETYFKGINKFGDWTKEEFRKFLNLKKPTHSSNEKFVRDPNFIAPESVDWRDRGAVLEVKNQGHCGSCWAFSATGAIEGQNFLKNNRTVSLSEQELLDCSVEYGNEGCDGGNIENAFAYVYDYGLATEEAYPYKGHYDYCESTSRSGVRVTNFVDLDSTEDALLEGVASVGPIAIEVNAALLQSYAGGIIDDPFCTARLNHGVLAVGYGVEDSTPYWILKNSWGADWGESGYYRAIRNANQQCGIGKRSTYPIVA